MDCRSVNFLSPIAYKLWQSVVHDSIFGCCHDCAGRVARWSLINNHRPLTVVLKPAAAAAAAGAVNERGK